MDLNAIEINTLKMLKEKGCVLIEDITQCIYTKQKVDIFDYIVGSYRKWFKTPDGGFIESNQLDNIKVPESENENFVRKQIDAMYLRNKYFETNDEVIKTISIRLNKEAVSSIGNMIGFHKMSNLSIAIMEKENNEINITKRHTNYKYLYHNLRQTENIKFACKNINEVTTAPLYFPIYATNRTFIQKILAENHIYAPVLWPINTEEVLINNNIKYIYQHILMLPIDQRYGIEEMNRIISIINNN